MSKFILIAREITLHQNESQYRLGVILYDEILRSSTQVLTLALICCQHFSKFKWYLDAGWEWLRANLIIPLFPAAFFTFTLSIVNFYRIVWRTKALFKIFSCNKIHILQIYYCFHGYYDFNKLQQFILSIFLFTYNMSGKRMERISSLSFLIIHPWAKITRVN